MYYASSGVTLDNTEVSVVINIDVAVGSYSSPFLLNFVTEAAGTGDYP